MDISNRTIDKLAHLAQLQFSEKEKAEIKIDLEKMVGFIEQLQKVDTTNIEPLIHISEAVNMLRTDEVKGSVSVEEALKNAAEKDNQFFTVPKVIKK